MTAGFGENRLAEKPTSLPGNIWYLNQEVLYMSLHFIVYLVCDKVIVFD
jgi:hypothetical protein